MYNDKRLRQAYLDEITDGRKPHEVISVQYATPDVLSELRGINGYVRTGGGDVIPIDLVSTGGKITPAPWQQIGEGVQSRLFVFPEEIQNPAQLYPNLSELRSIPDLFEDMGAVVRNLVSPGQFTAARLFNKGIPGYKNQMFLDSNTEFNHELFQCVVQLLSGWERVTDLVKNPRSVNSQLMQNYAVNLAKKIERRYIDVLLNPDVTRNMDPDVISSMQRDFRPKTAYYKI